MAPMAQGRHSLEMQKGGDDLHLLQLKALLASIQEVQQVQGFLAELLRLAR